MKKILKRSDYLTIINELIDIPFNSFDAYMEELEREHLSSNAYFYDNLYKDVNYITSKYDNEGDGDLVIENGDFVIERGDFKITGKTTNLHLASRWCWMKIIPKIIEEGGMKNFHKFPERMDRYEKDFLKYDEYTPDYKKELDKIVKQLKRYRDGKTTKTSIKDMPVWLKITLGILGGIGVIVGVISFAFKPEGQEFIKWLLSYFQ